MTRKRSSETERSVSSSAAAVPARRKTVAERPRKKLSVSPAEPVSQPAIAVAPVAQAVEAVALYQPSYAEVAALAYSFWEARGCQGGSPDEDWVRAEQQLRLRTA